MRQLDISLPPGLAYRAGDHLGVCPKNDPERVERLARCLGATLDGLFMAPRTMNVPWATLRNFMTPMSKPSPRVTNPYIAPTKTP